MFRSISLSQDTGFSRLRSESQNFSTRVLLKTPVQYAGTENRRSVRLFWWDSLNTVFGYSNRGASQELVVSRFEIVGVAVVGMTRWSRTADWG